MSTNIDIDNNNTIKRKPAAKPAELEVAITMINLLLKPVAVLPSSTTTSAAAASPSKPASTASLPAAAAIRANSRWEGEISNVVAASAAIVPSKHATPAADSPAEEAAAIIVLSSKLGAHSAREGDASGMNIITDEIGIIFDIYGKEEKVPDKEFDIYIKFNKCWRSWPDSPVAAARPS